MNKEQWFRGKTCGSCIEITAPALNLDKALGVVTDQCTTCKAGELKIQGEGSEEATCKDLDGWKDSDGDGCSVYFKSCQGGSVVPGKEDNIAKFANADGVDAAEACC